MGDLIDRQVAIEALKEAFNPSITNFVKAKLVIENLPPAERKKGKWIRNDNGTYSCSLCQSWIPEEQYYYYYYARFCLCCGARMEGQE